MLTLMLAAFAVAQTADALTFYQMISAGGTEANPIVQWLYDGHVAAPALAKAAVTLGVAGILPHLGYRLGLAVLSFGLLAAAVGTLSNLATLEAL